MVLKQFAKGVAAEKQMIAAAEQRGQLANGALPTDPPTGDRPKNCIIRGRARAHRTAVVRPAVGGGWGVAQTQSRPAPVCCIIWDLLFGELLSCQSSAEC